MDRSLNLVSNTRYANSQQYTMLPRRKTNKMKYVCPCGLGWGSHGP